MAEQTVIPKNFNGARVVSFESRMADVMSESIRKNGGVSIQAPSMREIPIEENLQAFSFASQLLAGKIDMIIFMTGVGTRYLIEALCTRYEISKIISAISKTTVVARGPKPIRVLNEYKIPITVTVPEPNTWREIIETLDLSAKSIELEGKTIAVQEYGESNDRLVAALMKRGAHVIQVPVYKWGAPKDTRPLLQAIQEIIAGKADIALFTNAFQIRSALTIAAKNNLEAKLKEALKKVVISSIGPTTSETLQELGISVDFEPTHPKLAQLVRETAERSEELIQSKRHSDVSTGHSESPQAVKNPHSETLRHASGATQSDSGKAKSLLSPFLQALKLEKTPYTPVWLMRQAGRYMKEYRDVRSKVSFIDLCKNPDLCAEVAVTAQERINADAAILFSDILLIVEPLGLDLEYSKEGGPVISGDVKTAAQIDKLKEIEISSLQYVFDAVKKTRAALKPQIPLIGFAGAPFTLAAYVIEGGSSKTFFQTKQLMHQDPIAWRSLMTKISRGLIQYLNAQIEAGANAVQIFDSWVGCLSPADYREYVLPYTKQVIDGIGKKAIRHPEPFQKHGEGSRLIDSSLPSAVQNDTNIPVIHFGTGTGTFLKEMREAGGDCIGVDFRVELDQAWQIIGHDKAIQGNLDPIVLFSSLQEIKKTVKKILSQAGGRPGHIFNLGHGILPKTPVDNVIALIDMVHEFSRK